MELLLQISASLQQGDDSKVHELTSLALQQGHAPEKILSDGLIAGMDIIGKQFRHHEIFLPDVLMAAKAMNAGLDLLKPLLQESGQIGLGKIVIGTVSGDLHDLGKNLVTIMLKGAGFEVIDLGKDVKPSTFVDTAISENATVIGMSALLTTTMPVMKSVVEILHERGLANSIKTIIGGAPLSDEYAREIGADAYAYDAANAVVKIKELMGV
ncbi:MAG: corrinoid protein [Candidatus Marinimicrobia bacterium]|jgi:5-methyltetrahydrofolate--homocysteine methyltransferase|nr:corrinoid protein [Candidatus Neomarinimicrobiota bacterium]MBT3683130.1 corrinoid protein [Candidatus Neomarinimicrobiota bacterium]MBT3760736.1 corrinoid protein [Candidatus Neomarinimicrobiota bacterium]MBT3896808.1 corrinoid protein [Candidatus Neomarinimicrobiota bacterium]MBT4174008.1 corrinoid protein [Candidatus Neomarinimicrobiota bacterium]